jgi:hypothetical protein
MINFLKKKILVLSILGLFLIPLSSFAQPVINLDGPSLLPRAEIFTTPHTGDFLVDSTFEVPIYINTGGNNINTINIKLNFDPSRLSIIKPSGGKSIFGIWLEPPSYDNKNGTASFVGVIPNGIVTSSGLIATVTFKAISVGEARINLTDYTSANLNDGVGSNVKLSLNGSFLTISPRTPDGVMIYSDTHPYQDHWYNNNSPILKWDSPTGINGYSILIDLNPGTIPPITINTNNASTSYENLKDGVWYFHVRANINGVWGNTSHFQIKIDTNPPAFFTPSINTIKDNSNSSKYLLSFLTTDSLSSIDHYEIGVLDKAEENNSSPIFVQTESPYLVSNASKNTHVIIRAFDNAGNIREASIDLYPGVNLIITLKKYALYLFIILTFLLLLELLLHYLFGHHILDHVKKMFLIFKKISSDDKKYEKIEEEINKVDNSNIPDNPIISNNPEYLDNLIHPSTQNNEEKP